MKDKRCKHFLLCTCGLYIALIGYSIAGLIFYREVLLAGGIIDYYKWIILGSSLITLVSLIALSDRST